MSEAMRDALKEMGVKDSGERQNFNTGAVRDAATGKPRPDLISPHANLREGAWLKLGAEKYKERNWEAGIPISRCIASLARHLESYKLGLRDEDHMAAIRCNAGFILHYEEEIKADRLPADLDDMPHYTGRLPRIVENRIQAKLDETFAEPPPGVQVGDRRIGPDGSPQVFLGPMTVEAKVQAKLDETFAETVPVVHCSGCGSGDKDWHLFGCPVSAAGVGLSPRRARTILESLEARVAGGELLGDRENSVLCRLRDEADQQRVDAAPDGAVVLGVDLASGPDQTVTQILESGDPWKAVEHLKQAPFTVYLCGPITGQEVDYTWRAAATAMLQAHGIRTLDPLRGKHRDQICNLGLGYKGQFAAPEIADRDQMDIDDADVILAHFPYDPPRQSIGSLMEIGMAVKAGKTVILCSVVPVFNEHLFCRNFTTLEPNFEQALNRIVAMAMARRR